MLGAALWIDFFLLGEVGGVGASASIPVTGAGEPLFYFYLDYLFPVMVNYVNDWRTVIKNSFLISLSQLWITLLCVLICVVMLFVVLLVPVTGLLAGSLTAYAVYALCKRAFSRIEAAKASSLDKA